MMKHGNPAKKMALEQLLGMMDDMEGESLKKGSPGAKIVVDIGVEPKGGQEDVEESPEHEATESPDVEAKEDDSSDPLASLHDSADAEDPAHDEASCTDEECPQHGTSAKFDAYMKKVKGKK